MNLRQTKWRRLSFVSKDSSFFKEVLKTVLSTLLSFEFCAYAEIFLKIGLAYFLYKNITLSDNLYHISSRLFRVTASMVALTDISFCCESGSSCFSSVHYSWYHVFTGINHASNLLSCRLSHCVLRLPYLSLSEPGGARKSRHMAYCEYRSI